MNDWLAGAITDASRPGPATVDNDSWIFSRSVLPPGLAVVDGEIMEVPGFMERRIKERNRLRKMVFDIQEKFYQRVRGDDVYATTVQEERDLLRGRVRALEQQMQTVSQSNDVQQLGVLDQTRYTAMEKQRDVYLQHVQTLEGEVKRLLGFGLDDGGPTEQR